MAHLIQKKTDLTIYECDKRKIQESENAFYIVDFIDYRIEGVKVSIIKEFSKEKFYLKEE